MQIKIFTLPIFDDGSDQNTLNKFLASQKILEIEQFFIRIKKALFENLNSLCCFPNLTDLKFNSAKLLKDISYISELKQLKTLEINFASIEDFSVLGGHPNLEVLKMRGTALEDISALFSNKNLKTLYLEKTKLKSITGIKENLPQLELLWIWDTKVKDLCPLDGMITLKELDLTMLKPKSWDFIQSLSGLERLDLCKSSFSDTSLLLKLPNLKYLRLDGSSIDQSNETCKQLQAEIAKRN